MSSDRTVGPISRQRQPDPERYRPPCMFSGKERATRFECNRPSSGGSGRVDGDYRPWSDLWPGSASPSCVLSVAADLDDRGIDHGVLQVWLVGGGVEYPLEGIGFGSIAVAPERRCSTCRSTAASRPPRTAHPHDPQYGFNEATVILPTTLRVRRLAQAMRFLRPLGVGQYKPVHPKLESQPSSPGGT